MSSRFAFLIFAPLALALSACPTTSNPLACKDACSHQEVKTFCDVDGVYPESDLANECIAPPSADACNRVETCPSLGRPYCTDDSMGVCVECIDGQDCGSGEICNASKACEAFTCTPGGGGDAACAGVDASQPYCGAGDICVGCLDSSHCPMAATGVCDQADFQCRGCEANADCDSKVCGIADGICALEADILYVEKGALGIQCTQAAPCGSIMTAVDLVTATRKTIVIGAGSYDERIAETAKTIRIVGDGVVLIDPLTVSAEPAVRVSGSAKVTLENVTISHGNGTADSEGIICENSTASLSIINSVVTNAEDIGIDVDSCSLTVTGSTISGNAGGGITSTGGSISITGSTISGNAGGGIDISNSDFTIVNNLIVQNGAINSAVGGVRISNILAATQVFDFNTAANNQKTEISVIATNLDCTTNTPLVASSNIVYGGFTGGTARPDLVTGGNCSLVFSDIKGGPSGNGNIDMPPLFVNAGLGDFKLQSGSPCIDAADPAATLATDIDGEMRPKGLAHDMGADEAE